MKQTVLITMVMVTALGGCTYDERPAVETRRLEHGVREGSVLGMDDPALWKAHGEVELESSDFSTEGAAALRLLGAHSFTIESTTLSVSTAIERFGVDILLPEQLTSVHEGALVLSLDCPSMNLFGAVAGEVGTGAVTTGRFETVSLELSPDLKESLKDGCNDLTLRLELEQLDPVIDVLVDNVRLEYFVSATSVPLCSFTEHPYSPDEELPNGYLTRHAWRSGASTQYEIARILRALEKEPEIIGYVADDVAREFIVLVDPSAPVDSLTLAEAWDALQPSINIAVRPGCISSETIDETRSLVEQALSHSDGYFVFDASNARFDVTLPPKSTALGKRLLDELGALVQVEYRDFGLHGRFDDGIPHYGAAAIGSLSGNDCTAGFVADKGSVRGAVTAGHCGSTGDFFASGPYTWGEFDSAAGTGWDMLFIKPQSASETFSARIHTDPCCPANRPVTAKSPPYVWQVMCISGRNFRAKCSVTVQSGPATKVISGTSYNNVWVGKRAGVDISAPGDSGAPLYVPVGFGNAAIVGMNIGGLNSSPHEETWFHSVTDVESQLGVTVAY